MLGYFTSECIDCAFRLQNISGTHQLHKLCGGNLNWTIHYIGNYNQGIAENECVSLFTECCCHCWKLPYKELFEKYNFLAASGPPF